jgi:hypothetical protein
MVKRQMVKRQMVKRRKNLLLLAVIMLITFSAGGQAAAFTDHVYDDAGLFPYHLPPFLQAFLAIPSTQAVVGKRLVPDGI